MDTTEPQDDLALREITGALLCELQEKLRDTKVIRNGGTQITLFRPVDYQYAQIVVGFRGVHLVFNPTKEASPDEIAKNIRGPFALEDPRMFANLLSGIELWERPEKGV